MRSGSMSAEKGKVWLPLSVVCVLFIVALVILQYSTNLQGDSVATEAGPRPGRTFFERKKRQVLKVWKKIQLFFGEDPDTLSLLDAWRSLDAALQLMTPPPPLRIGFRSNPSNSGWSPDPEGGGRPSVRESESPPS
jgi:hypothetical protein